MKYFIHISQDIADGVDMEIVQEQQPTNMNAPDATDSHDNDVDESVVSTPFGDPIFVLHYFQEVVNEAAEEEIKNYDDQGKGTSIANILGKAFGNSF